MDFNFGLVGLVDESLQLENVDDHLLALQQQQLAQRLLGVPHCLEDVCVLIAHATLLLEHPDELLEVRTHIESLPLDFVFLLKLIDDLSLQNLV